MAYSKISGVEIAALAAAIPAASPLEVPLAKVFPQTTSDLGFEAAHAIIHRHNFDVNDIGILLFVSRTYDYRGPITAAVLQHRLGIPTACIAFDIPHGTTGLATGLMLASAQLNVIDKPLALVIIGDTNTRLLAKNADLYSKMGDGAAAFLLKKSDPSSSLEFETFTDSILFEEIIFPGGGFRVKEKGSVTEKQFGINFTDPDYLVINEKALKEYLTVQIPDHWKASQIQAHLKNSQQVPYLLQVNELGLITIEDKNVRVISEDSEISNRFYGSAMLPVLLCAANFEHEENLSIIGITSGEGLSTSIIKFSIQKEAIIPLIYSETVFEGAWVPTDF